MENLPLDLIPSILDAVECLPQPDANFGLAALSAVSRSWHAESQRRLYHAPYLPLYGPGPSMRHAFSLLTTLQINRSLADHVRSLNLGAWTTSLKTKTSVDRRAISRWAIDLLSCCPRLRELNFPGVTVSDAPLLEDVLSRLVEVEALEFAEGVILPDPWAIHLDVSIQSEFGSATWTFEAMGRILAGWPRLRRLRMGARLRGRPGPGLPCAFEDFELCLIKHAVVSPAYIARLLDGSKSSLRRLSIVESQVGTDNAATDAALAQVLEKYGGNLVHLATMTKNRHTPSRSLAPIVQFCPSLESLSLGSLAIVSPSTFELLSSLPHLHHIHLPSVDFTIQHETKRLLLQSPDLVVDAVTRLPALRTLTLGESGRDFKPWEEDLTWNEEQVDDMALALERAGIKFVCHDVCPPAEKLLGDLLHLHHSSGLLS